VRPSRWTIRDADPATDAEACLAIYAPFVRDTAVSFEEVVPGIEEFRGRMRTSTTTHAWLVLEADGRVVGYAYGSAHRARAAYRWAAEVTVYIDPEHRGLGGGRQLYEQLFERLRDRGYRVLCAGVTLPNDSSVGLHTAMGFEPVGVYKRIGWKAGAWHDVEWLQLELAPPTASAPAEIGPGRPRQEPGQ
jgi:L-amino acid N-acyltransferase YncA